MLFSNKRRHSLSIPATDKNGKAATIASLIDYLCKNTMKDNRKELFVLDNHLYASPSRSGLLPALGLALIPPHPLHPRPGPPFAGPLSNHVADVRG